MQAQTEKRLYTLLIIVFIAFLVVNSIMAYAILTQSSRVAPVGPGGEQTKTINVSGVGTVTASPDRAHVSFAVWTEATTATDALTSNSNKMNKVIKALTDAGIPMDQIKTTSYSVEPVIQYPEKSAEPPKIVGYIARNEVQVTLTDVTSVGRIIDTAVVGGANVVSSVYFTLSESKEAEFRNEAIKEAVKDADSKAKTIASSLGVQLIGPTSISLGYEYPIARYEKAASADVETPIVPGPLTITANVQVAYSFK